MSDTSNLNNEWEKNGDCRNCRRQSYCSKPCKANKTEAYRTLQSAVGSAMLRSVIRSSLKEN